MKKYILAALLCTLISLQAENITFNSLAGTHISGDTTIGYRGVYYANSSRLGPLYTYFSAGAIAYIGDYRFKNSSPVLPVNERANYYLPSNDQYYLNSANNGSDYLAATNTTLTKNSGVFDLTSFDFAARLASYPNIDILVTGTMNDSSTIEKTISTTSIDYSTLVLNWTNLVSVNFQTLNENLKYFALDNVVINENSATPEPSAYALMLLGLIGLVAFSRKQRTEQAA